MTATDRPTQAPPAAEMTRRPRASGAGSRRWAATRAGGCVISLVAMFLALATPAAGDTPAAGNKATAESLFRDGQRLLDAKDYARACKAFAASHEAEQSAGALLNLARCEELRGNTATAWATFAEAATFAARNNDAVREQGARQHAARLEQLLSKLTIEVSAPVPSLVVKRGEETVPAASYGLPVAVDPGEHTVSASAPGHEPWSTRVTVGPNRDSQVVTIPALQPGSGTASSGSSGLRIASYVLLGVGGIALVGGTVMGVRAIGQRNTLADNCTVTDANGKKTCTTQADKDLLAELKDRTAPIATAGIVVGSAAAAAGIVMLILSSGPEPGSGADAALWLRPALGPDGGGLSVGTRF